jgi:hypothetical protein
MAELQFRFFHRPCGLKGLPVVALILVTVSIVTSGAESQVCTICIYSWVVTDLSNVCIFKEVRKYTVITDNIFTWLVGWQWKTIRNQWQRGKYLSGNLSKIQHLKKINFPTDLLFKGLVGWKWKTLDTLGRWRSTNINIILTINTSLFLWPKVGILRHINCKTDSRASKLLQGPGPGHKNIVE